MAKRVKRWSLKRKDSGESGQMAIFVALIFQVLFVFFAMTINIGLLVHDKINLQNSVDLAAYYGAQRQAEMLNLIAHTNYQIRQSWKLLAWRIRAVGDANRRTHPMKAPSNQERPIPMRGGGGAEDYASVCANSNKWQEQYWGTSKPPENQYNVCYDPSSIRVPPLPETVDLTGPLVPINAIIRNLSKDLQNAFGGYCSQYGPSNFILGATWLAQYKVDVKEKKELIRQLADNLSQNTSDFRDITGDTTFVGVQKTLLNNLTRSNREGSPQIEFFNSLGVTGNRNSWLREAPIKPYVFYTDFLGSGNTGCSALRKRLNDNLNGIPEGFDSSGNTDQQSKIRYMNAVRSLMQIIYEPQDLTSPFHSIAGVEKNPWVMAYVGVRAQTRPVKPFAPFGSPIRLTAKAFAKPFGGRVGPWIYSSWPRGSGNSAGQADDRIDPLLPPVADVDPTIVAGLDHVVPNYSRYPGDRLGLRAQRAITAFVPNLMQFSFSYKLYEPTTDVSPNGVDILARFPNVPGDHPMRKLERAAISPDVFDITYYSIDPQFFVGYSEARRAFPIKHDMGFLLPDTPYSINSQITLDAPTVAQKAPWMVDSWQHTLTGWVPMGGNDYSGINPEAFGRCGDGLKAIPGGCPIGGRTGYSVKLVNIDYLKSSLPLGGVSGESGPIYNPPPPSWQSFE